MEACFPLKPAALFAAAGLLFFNIVVPPFQNPDEPHHFAAAVLYARGDAERERVESGVIEMMDRAHWWRLVGLGRPRPLPRRLADIDFLMEGSKSGDFRTRLDRFVLWHRAIGMAMKPISGLSLESLYYICRLVSSLFMLAAFFFIWKAREILAAVYGPIVKWGFALVFFLPQYLLTGTAVSPDAFVVLISAAFFNGAAALIIGAPPGERGPGTAGAAERVRSGWKPIGRAVLVVVPALVGLLTDRSAFVLAILALAVPILTMRRGNYQSVVVRSLLGAVAAIWALYFLVLRFPLEFERILQSAKYVFHGGWKAVFSMIALTGFPAEFWTFTADGVLLKFGWLVFDPPRFVFWIWRAALIAVVAGLVIRSGAWAGKRMNGIEDAAAPIRLRWVVFSLAAVGIQAVGMWVFYGANGHLGQGRYFFPVIVPLAVFAVWGLSGIGERLKRGAGRIVVIGAVMAEFLLLALASWHDLVPVFHLILRGPHPGV